ncbi:uncharacterized protein F4807DRAFT_459978 [Annulohypoxylon truncatum]|uniref:uncharacterized protein n=1 Tax=Annulohypoxylon truncatum TaxID=327061 RepID=UPI0020075894|nr:uncharacterized protein F4807DRAFT_459978 [Annulohypoxylon truncatum]KAI1210147.1 hypothetical protein F4807DRAFT_459978 [Annulohypoxylon truncatum]
MDQQANDARSIQDPKLLADMLDERDKLLDISFRAVTKLKQRIKNLQEGNRGSNQRPKGVSQTDAQHTQLGEANRKLREEKKMLDERVATLSNQVAQLQSDVRERETQIFSLQPFRIEISQDEAKQSYDVIIRDINAFIDDWLNPLQRDSKLQNESVLRAKRNGQDSRDFREYFIKYKDLHDIVLNFPNLDVDNEILTSYVARFIIEMVFEKGFSAIHPECARMLDLVEYSMRNSTNPVSDEYTTMSWRAQTSFAMLAIPEVEQAQRESRDQLTNTLAHLLGFMFDEKDREAFTNSIATSIIDPALKFQARLLCSTSERFSFGVHTEARAGQNFQGEMSNLRNLDCLNVAANFRKFDVDKLNPIPHIGQLQRELYMACSLHPALFATRVSSSSSNKPILISKEQMLVSYQRSRNGKDLMSTTRGGSASLLYKILNA